MASPPGATWPIRTCPSISSLAAASRSRCSGAWSRPRSPPMRWSSVSMSRADEAVARVSLWKGEDVQISPLSGGLTNENYLVAAAGMRYVVRVPGQSTELLAIDRANQVHNTRAAATTGIAPKALEGIPDRDVMVLEYRERPTMSARGLQSVEMATRVAASFRRLHGAPRFLQDFNIFPLIASYLQILTTHTAT